MIKLDQNDKTDQTDQNDKTDQTDETTLSEEEPDYGAFVFGTFKKAEKTKQTPLIVKVINKYKSVGTIEDYEKFTLQRQKNTGNEKVIKLTFKDYKNMIEKKVKYNS